MYEDCNYIDDDTRRQNKRQRILKGKSKTTCMSVSLHFTTYFPNVSYVNSSKRLRKEGCSNEGKKKQARRQEEKEAATREREDGGREGITNGRERKRDSM